MFLTVKKRKSQVNKISFCFASSRGQTVIENEILLFIFYFCYWPVFFIIYLVTRNPMFLIMEMTQFPK